MEYEDIEDEVKDGVATLELNSASHLKRPRPACGEVLSAIDGRTVTTR